MIKKIGFFVVMAAIIAAVGGCQKEELTVRQLTDEVQPQEVVQPDMYVEGDYLVFKDFETLDSIKKELNGMSINAIQNFEAKLNFKSAFSYRKELLEKADELPDHDLTEFLDEVSKKGFFDKNNQEFTYPFYNESYAKVLNPDGKVKIGNTFYQFEGTTEIVTPDLSGFNNTKELKNLEHRVQLNPELSQLKSGELLKETMLKDNRLRSLLQLKREQFNVYDWIIDPIDGIVWGFVGFNYEVYYRFYSYKQYSLYKSDRPTYFNWRTKKAQVGGNDGYWYLNYYNASPYLERSPTEGAVFYFVVYGTGLTSTAYLPPNVYSVIVSEFWSDYMSSFHGTLTYP
ncbi:MAG: hypothetical protein ACP5D9_18850 [Mariniphaga sp.]